MPLRAARWCRAGRAGWAWSTAADIAATGVDLVISIATCSCAPRARRRVRAQSWAVDVVTAVVDSRSRPIASSPRQRRAGDLEIGLLVAECRRGRRSVRSSTPLSTRCWSRSTSTAGRRWCSRTSSARRMAATVAAGSSLCRRLWRRPVPRSRALFGHQGVRPRARRRPLVRAARSGVDVVAIRPGSTRTPGWQSSQPASGDLKGVMEPADVVREALAALGTTPSTPAGCREPQGRGRVP